MAGLLLAARSYKGLLASLLGARTLLGASGLTTRNKKLLVAPDLELDQWPAGRISGFGPGTVCRTL